MNAIQLVTAPTTDIESPQISMSRKSRFLSAFGPAFEMNTAPVVESGLRSTMNPQTMIEDTRARRFVPPTSLRSGGAMGRNAGRMTPVVLA